MIMSATLRNITLSLLFVLFIVTLIGVPRFTAAQDIPPLPQDTPAGPMSAADCPSNTLFEPNGNGVGGTCRPEGSAVFQDTAITPGSCIAKQGVSVSGVLLCIWYGFTSLIGTVPAAIGVWVAGVAAILFDWVVTHTIVSFNTSIYTPEVRAGIETAWQAFRDLANIVIIGMFTFISIGMILGTQTFGGKKMVARILIIAVLINFSLLFTRLIIESSNFVAVQFHKAASLPSGTAQSISVGVTTSSGGASAPVGISGKLMEFMGITSFADTYNAILKFAQNQESGWFAILFGIFIGILMFAVAAVFLYASFILIARVIILLFLLMTAPLAFASFLLPGKISDNYGWGKWWQSLLKSAVLAPMLMIMLWVTVMMANAFKAKGGTLGDLVANPQSSLNISALFSYFIILGMLFASIRISSSFATKISGFNYAAMLPALAFGAAGRVVGAVTRNTVGRGFSAAAGAAESASKDPSKSLLSRRLYDFTAQNLKKGAAADYNPARFKIAGQGLGSEIQRVAGFKKLETLAGKELGGFDGVLKKRLEEVAKQAKRITPERTPQERAAEERRIRAEVDRERPDIAQQQATSAKQLQEATHQLSEAQKSQQKLAESFDNRLQELNTELQKATTSAAADRRDPAKDERVKELTGTIEREKSQHKADMNSQEERIKQAQVATDRARANIDNADRARKYLIDQKLPGTVADTAARIVNQRWTNILGAPAASDSLAKAARKQVREQTERDQLKKQLAELKKMDDKPTPDPAPTPRTPPASPPAH